jgi:hypothetical protein
MIETLEKEFVTNANQTGKQTFSFVKEGVSADGKKVCLYKRTSLDGQVFGYEIFIPSVKKAGTYPLPNGKTITYEQDFEEYPGAAKFGKSAWFCSTLITAEVRFAELMERGTIVESTGEDPSIEVEDKPIIPVVKSGRGRPKADRPALNYPEGEFSTIELAELNKVEYPIAFVFLKEQEEAGQVKRTRTERRASRGKETQLFQKI